MIHTVDIEDSYIGRVKLCVETDIYDGELGICGAHIKCGYFDFGLYDVDESFDEILAGKYGRGGNSSTDIKKTSASYIVENTVSGSGGDSSIRFEVDHATMQKFIELMKQAMSLPINPQTSQ